VTPAALKDAEQFPTVTWAEQTKTAPAVRIVTNPVTAADPGAIGAALTISIRRGGLILALIVLPLLTPTLIFGAGAVMGALDGTGQGAFLFLAAFSVAAVALSPFAAAASVRLNIAG